MLQYIEIIIPNSALTAVLSLNSKGLPHMTRRVLIIQAIVRASIVDVPVIGYRAYSRCHQMGAHTSATQCVVKQM